MPSTLAEKIGAVSADQARVHFNIEIFGDYGAGKTHFIGTAEDHKETSPVLLLDIEGGAATLRSRPGIEVVQVRSINELADIHGDLKADNGKTYKTVAVDSLTELQKLDIAEIMRGVDPNKQDPDVPSPREWGKTLVHMRKICRAYKDLPCNVIFTALAVRVKDDDGTVMIKPAMQGKALDEIPAFFDVVAYMDTIVEKDRIERRLITQQHPRYRAKDRLGVSDGSGIVVDPTVPTLWNNLNNHKATK